MFVISDIWRCDGRETLLLMPMCACARSVFVPLRYKISMCSGSRQS